MLKKKENECRDAYLSIIILRFVETTLSHGLGFPGCVGIFPWLQRSDRSRGEEVYMSLDVLNQVWTAEMAFLSDMYLLDSDFFRFVWGLLQQREAAAPTTVALAAHAGTKASLAFLVWT